MRRLLTLKGKRFSFLPVILIVLVVQFIILQLLLLIELKVPQFMSFSLMIKINFFIITICGGIIAIRFYNKTSAHIGGICGALFITLSELYSGHFNVDLSNSIIFLLAYLSGYFGSTLYKHKSVITRVG